MTDRDRRAGKGPSTGPRLVLGSASPARRATLLAAGLHPEVVVSGVEEDGVVADSPAALAGLLARHKGEAVRRLVGPAAGRPTVLVTCDSVLELDGRAYGKPVDAAEARRFWQRMRGATGIVHTGHHVTVLAPAGDPTPPRGAAEVASTTVHFADPDDAEIDAYVATGEPLRAAGAFSLGGLGGAFVRGVEGDPHNVVGISLPLLRRLLASLGIGWASLWH